MVDAFEVRMHFLDSLRHLTSTHASIQKTVSYAIKYGPRCADDLWDCLIEECEKASLNARLNMLHLLDSLLGAGGGSSSVYLGHTERDLEKLVDLVVPEVREGVLNLMSTEQVLKSWRTKRILEPSVIEKAEETLRRKKALLLKLASKSSTSSSSSGFTNFSKSDILRRIEDDRERHKRLRERIWILPLPSLSSSSPSNPKTFSRLATSLIKTSTSTPSLPTISTSGTTTTGWGQTSSPDSPASPAGISGPSPSASSSQSISSYNPLKRKSTSQAAAAAAAGHVKKPIPPSGTGTPPGPPKVTAIDIEFDQIWEAEGPLDEDDRVVMRLENERCFGPPEEDVAEGDAGAGLGMGEPEGDGTSDRIADGKEDRGQDGL